MDLLFKRYANPFVLLDGMIETGRFFEFVIKLSNITAEEKIHEIWLHRVLDKSYNDFKEALMVRNVTKKDLETTLKESKNILDNFIPENEGVENGLI